MIKNKTFVKLTSTVFLVPTIIYVIFYCLGEDFVRSWFWATIVAIGNLMLLFSSPNRRITEGIRKLGFFSWMFTVAVSLIPIFIIPEGNKIILIVRSLCLFISFVGFSAFQVRIMGGLKR